RCRFTFFCFFLHVASTWSSSLSLHDALPILRCPSWTSSSVGHTRISSPFRFTRTTTYRFVGLDWGECPSGEVKEGFTSPSDLSRLQVPRSHCNGTLVTDLQRNILWTRTQTPRRLCRP